jgi:hypothetical protein
MMQNPLAQSKIWSAATANIPVLKLECFWLTFFFWRNTFLMVNFFVIRKADQHVFYTCTFLTFWDSVIFHWRLWYFVSRLHTLCNKSQALKIFWVQNQKRCKYIAGIIIPIISLHTSTICIQYQVLLVAYFKAMNANTCLFFPSVLLFPFLDSYYILFYAISLLILFIQFFAPLPKFSTQGGRLVRLVV